MITKQRDSWEQLHRTKTRDAIVNTMVFEFENHLPVYETLIIGGKYDMARFQCDTEEEAVAQHASVPLKVKHAELKPDRMNLWQSLKHEFHRAWFT